MNKARIAFVCLVVVAALSLGGVALASSSSTARRSIGTSSTRPARRPPAHRSV